VSDFPTLDELDADIAPALGRLATFTATPPPPADPDDPPVAPVPQSCFVMVDQGIQRLGDFQSLSANRTAVTIFLHGSAAEGVAPLDPVPGDERGTVECDGRTYRLDALEDADDSRQVWVVTEVPAP